MDCLTSKLLADAVSSAGRSASLGHVEASASPSFDPASTLRRTSGAASSIRCTSLSPTGSRMSKRPPLAAGNRRRSVLFERAFEHSGGFGDRRIGHRRVGGGVVVESSQGGGGFAQQRLQGLDLIEAKVDRSKSRMSPA